MLHLIHKGAAFGFGGHGNDIAINIHFPPVIQTPQPAFFVPAIDQRCLAVRAKFIKQAKTPFGVAERYIAFPEHLNTKRLAVGLFHFFNQAYRGPVLTHKTCHRCITGHARQQFIFFRCKH